MAEEVVSTYLRNKFSSILREAEEDPSSPLQIILRFQSIEKRINSMCENRSSAGGASAIPVAPLYDLIDALSECRILAHQRREAAASKKGFFRVDPLSELLFKRKMRKRLYGIQTELMKRSNPPEDDTGSSSSPGIVIEQTYPILDPSVIIGFDSQAEKIEGLLLMRANYNLAEDAASTKLEKEESDQQGFRAIGIVGRCGCGKTALAQKVFANPRIQEEFSPRIWVCLSNLMVFEKEIVDPRVRVLIYILKEIGGHDCFELEYYAEYDSINKLLEKVQRGLMGKRYLIVLDDAWRVDEWYADLGYRLPKGYATGESFSHGLPKGSGGAIIVTSRRESVIRRTVGDKHVIRMEPHLSDEICWKIFSDVVLQQGIMKLKLNERKDEVIRNSDGLPLVAKMKDEVIRNCDGLPLTAKTLANIISNLLKLWIPARKLAITGGENTSYWRWTSLPTPDDRSLSTFRLEEVAELVDVCWLDIKGNVDLKKLLLKTSYSAYLVFKLNDGSYGLEHATARIAFVRSEGKNVEVVEEYSVFIDREKTPGERGHVPQPRGEGWMEIKLGEFFNNLGDDGTTMEAAFFEFKKLHWKSGLIVRGIEVRPNYIY